VEWTTILFFVALFIIVGYLEKTGLLDWVAHKLVDVSGGGFALIMVILWGSAVFSAFVDNIPFTATMIPIVASLVAMDPALDHHHAIWWALSMGACLGGNATVIGASANVVVSGIARRNRLPMTFFNFAKVAAPTTAAVLLISSAYLYLLWVL
jgi:Na+/H+ antiporter NhaD/arsenite permease-like protein